MRERSDSASHQKPRMNQLSQQTRAAIEALSHCHQMCQSMAMTHCQELGGDHARPQHLRLMLDCAGFCAFTADALGRKSQFQIRLTALCADVCETCAADCSALGDMEECVEACGECARLCREISRPEHADILGAAPQAH
jgi:hypothetical protein